MSLTPYIPTRLYNSPFAVVGAYTPYELGFNQSRFHLARLTLASRCERVSPLDVLRLACYTPPPFSSFPGHHWQG